MHQIRQDGVNALISSMNEAAIGGGNWLELLHGMEAALDVHVSCIEIIDKRAGGLRILSGEPVDPAAQRLYEERVHLVNPRFTLLPTTPVGAVRADRHIDPEIDAAAGEYYDWLKLTGCRFFAGIKLFDTRDFLALSSIHVPKSRGPIDAQTEALYQRLAPHLANALSVHLALAPRGDGIEAFEDGALGSSRAYALLDRGGRILECSAEFERMIGSSGALSIRDRRLAAASAGKAELACLIGAATSAEPPAAPLQPVRIACSRGRHGLLMRAVRLGQSRELFARLRPVAMLVLIDLDSHASDVSSELRAGWGLTQREAELAMLIGEGRRLDQAAALLGISELTARHHLKAIFRRMEIERQTDLVRLITRLGA